MLSLTEQGGRVDFSPTARVVPESETCVSRSLKLWANVNHKPNVSCTISSRGPTITVNSGGVWHRTMGSGACGDSYCHLEKEKGYSNSEL